MTMIGFSGGGMFTGEGDKRERDKLVHEHRDRPRSATRVSKLAPAASSSYNEARWLGAPFPIPASLE